METKTSFVKKMIQSKFLFCKKCHTPNSRPLMIFNEDGVCSACTNNEFLNKNVSWEEREEEFKRICKDIRSKKNNYDCVVPFSGGKDSSSIAHKLKFKFGLNPLLVTFAPLISNEIGILNRQQIINQGFTNILVKPDGNVSRYLSKRFFIERGNPKVHWNAGIAAAPSKIAVEKKIDVIFFAEDPMLVYGGRLTDQDSTRHFTPSRIKETWVGDDVLNWVDENVSERDLEPYMVPEEVYKKNSAIFFGYFFPWDIVKNYEYVKKEYNFTIRTKRCNGTFTNFDSLDDLMDDLYYYMQYIKFGFGRCSRDVSRHIHNKHLSTEEGLSLIKKYDGEFPKENLQEYLKYFNMTHDELIKIIDLHRSPEIWVKEGNSYQLKNKLS